MFDLTLNVNQLIAPLSRRQTMVTKRDLSSDLTKTTKDRRISV